MFTKKNEKLQNFLKKYILDVIQPIYGHFMIFTFMLLVFMLMNFKKLKYFKKIIKEKRKEKRKNI
jgi:hypothetical protein